MIDNSPRLRHPREGGKTESGGSASSSYVSISALMNIART